jgi:septal ring factor EnvC (AmiA/AmiB activator)
LEANTTMGIRDSFSPEAISNGFAKWLPIFLTVTTMLVGAVLWATSSHLTIREDAIRLLQDVKEEIQLESDKHYADSADVKVLKQLLENNKEEIREIKNEQKEQSKKIDEIHGRLFGNRRK